MAKELNMQFSGTIGPLVGSLRNGSYYYRSKPKKFRQTKATKAAASRFGLAARVSKVLRTHLKPCLPDPGDQHMRRRLEGSIRQWLGFQELMPPQATGDIPFVNHFNFNATDNLADRLKITPGFSITGPHETRLHLPAFIPVKQVVAPAGTTHLLITIGSVALGLNSQAYCGSSHQQICLPYDDDLQPARDFAMALQTDRGNLLVAVIQLQFGIQNGDETEYRKYAATAVAGIVGAIYL